MIRSNAIDPSLRDVIGRGGGRGGSSEVESDDQRDTGAKEIRELNDLD